MVRKYIKKMYKNNIISNFVYFLSTEKIKVLGLRNDE